MAIWLCGYSVVLGVFGYRAKNRCKNHPKIGPKWVQNWSKIGLGGSKIDQNSFLEGLRGSWGPCWLDKPRWIRKRRFVGPFLAPKLGAILDPCWVKTDSKTTSKLIGFMERISVHLGVDFGTLLGSKIGSKSALKIASWKTVKFDSRLGGGSIFEVPGGSKIERKSFKNRFKNDINIKPHFKSYFGPCWGQVGRQVEGKLGQKPTSLENWIRKLSGKRSRE